jgi:hypothetical protein
MGLYPAPILQRIEPALNLYLVHLRGGSAVYELGEQPQAAPTLVEAGR